MGVDCAALEAQPRINVVGHKSNLTQQHSRSAKIQDSFVAEYISNFIPIGDTSSITANLRHVKHDVETASALFTGV